MAVKDRRARSPGRPYRKRRFREAAAAFREVLAINGADKAAQLCIDRCEYFERTPPPDDWNGVWVTERK